jgi:uncharacterized protein (DUF2147 family)
MKKIGSLIILLVGLVLKSYAQAPAKDAVLGEWLSENKDGKVLIFKQGDKFFGKISWGKDDTRKDGKNPDERLRNQTIVGSVILKNFEFTGQKWEDGTVYDPNNGKTYSCTMKLSATNQLELRGFVGISLLGRTTVWTRVK